MSADLIHRSRYYFDDGTFVEMVIWRLSEAVEGSRHEYKYRLFYGRSGERVIGYDNERLKGDHRNVGDREEPYEFTDVDTLLRDFLADVDRWRSS